MAESVASAIPAAPSILTTTATQDPFLPVPSKDLSPAHALSRPQSTSSRRSDDSRMDVKKGDSGTTGVIIIGLDTNDAATVGRTTASRGSSSVIDPQRPSETNDTERDETEVHNNFESDHSENNIDDKPPLSIKHLTAAPPVDHHGRPNSISTPPSSSSHRQNTSSVDSNPRTSTTGRPRQTSSVDHPDTTPTTLNSETASQRRHSATEFQKFRHHLHGANPTFSHPENEEWQLHPNPHHPNTKTEILRIERAYTPVALPTKTRVSAITNFDVLIPRFSPTYPPILREYGISDGEWTGFIQRVNIYCMEAFDPFRWNNLVINIIAVLSCWLSEWIMPNITKRKLLQLENYIDEVNRGPWREKGVQIISLRRTAYLNIDIEVQTSLLNDSNNTQPTETGQGTWGRGTPASDPTSPSGRPATGVNSQSSLMEGRNSAGAV